jgi:hypothetical protein
MHICWRTAVDDGAAQARIDRGRSAVTGSRSLGFQHKGIPLQVSCLPLALLKSTAFIKISVVGVLEFKAQRTIESMAAVVHRNHRTLPAC